MNLAKKIIGKLFGDRGYISPKLSEKLRRQNTELITKVRKNMKPRIISAQDKLLLKKRGVVKSVGSILKEILNLEYTHHRSVVGFFEHVISTLIAYAFRPKKQSTINLLYYQLSSSSRSLEKKLG